MAINEKIVTGRKFRRLIDREAKLWQRFSWWTKGSDVEFDDGRTAEQKVGNINGITSDFTVDDSAICASSKLTNKIKTDLNDGIINEHIQLVIDENGKIGWKKDGADTVLNFSKSFDSFSSSDVVITYSNQAAGSLKDGKDTFCEYITNSFTANAGEIYMVICTTSGTFTNPRVNLKSASVSTQPTKKTLHGFNGSVCVTLYTINETASNYKIILDKLRTGNSIIEHHYIACVKCS